MSCWTRVFVMALMRAIRPACPSSEVVRFLPVTQMGASRDRSEASWQPAKLPDQMVWILGSGETKQQAHQIATGKPRSFPAYQGMVLGVVSYGMEALTRTDAILLGAWVTWSCWVGTETMHSSG